VVAPTAVDLLTAWEWGQGSGVPQRSAAVLAVLLPDRRPEELVAMSIGERDLHLLHGHRDLFGSELDCVLGCAECSAELELTLAVEDLLASAAAGRDGAVDDPAVLMWGGWRVHFRRIALGDLLAAAVAADARQELLRRCVVATVTPDGHAADGFPELGLPPDVEHALVEQLEQRDVIGLLDLDLTCPDCGHAWSAPLDPASFLWAEIDDWAHRTLREVHLLAAAYGWDEERILGLSPWRRQTYLRMNGHG